VSARGRRSWSPTRLDEPEYAAPATRIALRPNNPHTGQEIDRDEVRKGYEYERGQFVTFTPEELRALDVESSHTIDLATFVPRAELTLGRRERMVLVEPRGQGLTLITLRAAEEVRAAEFDGFAGSYRHGQRSMCARRDTGAQR